MKTEIYHFNDGGFMIVCRESTPHGFTNHRIEVHKVEKGWQLEPIKAFEKPKLYSDLGLLHYECRMISCSANPFLAECGKAAMELINNGCGANGWTENQFKGVHEEFVLVLQGDSPEYRFGSDRIANAEHFCNKHAEAMLSFNSSELHPETCAMYRNMAYKTLSAPSVA